MYVDIHCHLDDKAYADDGSHPIAQVIARARAAGLKAIISNGTGFASNEMVRTLCERFPLVRPAYGLYPTEPGSAEDDAHVIAWIREEAVHGKYPPAAIGEIGLDAVEPLLDSQRIRLRAMLALATELRLPVILHTRKAEQETFEELEAACHVTPVVMHCFGGSKKLILEGAKRGYFFSVPATITRATQFQMIAELVPLGQLLTETDAPYLSAEKDGFPNEPRAVVRTVERIAAIKKVTAEECKRILFMNYQRVFGST